MHTTKALAILLVGICPLMQGRAGMIIGGVVDATIEVAKIPFKVGRAVVDVATGGEKKDGKQ